MGDKPLGEFYQEHHRRVQENPLVNKYYRFLIYNRRKSRDSPAFTNHLLDLICPLTAIEVLEHVIESLQATERSWLIDVPSPRSIKQYLSLHRSGHDTEDSYPVMTNVGEWLSGTRFRLCTTRTWKSEYQRQVFGPVYTFGLQISAGVHFRDFCVRGYERNNRIYPTFSFDSSLKPQRDATAMGVYCTAAALLARFQYRLEYEAGEFHLDYRPMALDTIAYGAFLRALELGQEALIRLFGTETSFDKFFAVQLFAELSLERLNDLEQGVRTNRLPWMARLEGRETPALPPPSLRLVEFGEEVTLGNVVALGLIEQEEEKEEEEDVIGVELSVDSFSSDEDLSSEDFSSDEE